PTRSTPARSVRSCADPGPVPSPIGVPRLWRASPRPGTVHSMRFAGERGQTAAEYLGALLLVTLIIGAVASTNVGEQIRHATSEQVCKIAAGGAQCAAPAPRGAPRHFLGNDPTAHAANVPCDGMTVKQCSALRAMINRAQAEHRQLEEEYIQYAADFATWVAA